MGRKKSESSVDRESLTTLKGSPEWTAWVRDLAEYDRNTIAGMIDRALVEYAKGHGFKREAPKR